MLRAGFGAAPVCSVLYTGIHVMCAQLLTHPLHAAPLLLTAGACTARGRPPPEMFGSDSRPSRLTIEKVLIVIELTDGPERPF